MLLLFALSKPSAPPSKAFWAESCASTILFKVFIHLLQRCFWWRWAESNRRPRHFWFYFIQPYFSTIRYQGFVLDPFAASRLGTTVESKLIVLKYGAPGRNRTDYLSLTRRVLCQWATRAFQLWPYANPLAALRPTFLKSSGNWLNWSRWQDSNLHWTDLQSDA